MRILIVADFLPPVAGGLERHAFEEAKLLRQLGHDVRAVALRPPGANPLTARDGVPITLIDGWRSHASRFASDPGRAHHPPFADPGVVRHLRAEIKRFRPDVVHAHGWIMFSANAACTDVPLVVTVHDQGLVCPKRSLVNAQGQICDQPTPATCRRCAAAHYGLAIGPAVATSLRHSVRNLDNVDRFIAVSSQVRDLIVADGEIAADRIVVVPNFFDHHAVAASSVARKPSWVPSGHYVVAVGSVSAFKGAGVLFDAWRGIDLPASLVMIGDIPDDAPADVPARTVLVGPRPHAEVMAAIRRADVLVVSTIGPEACSTTVMEAMASNTVVVATRTGGTPDLIDDGATGILVPPGDVAATRVAVERALADTAFARRLSSAALEVAPQWASGAVVRQILDVLRTEVGAPTALTVDESVERAAAPAPSVSGVVS